MKKTILGLLLLGLFGCATAPSIYEQRWRETQDWALQEMDRSRISCKSDSIVLGSCDSVTQKFFLEQKSLFETLCKDPKLTPDACNETLVQTLLARFKLRYKYADWTVAKTRCDADPKICGWSAWQKIEMFERFLANSDAKQIHDFAMATKNEIQTQTNLAALEKRKAYLNAISSFQYNNRPQIHCTSSIFGSMVQTNCN